MKAVQSLPSARPATVLFLVVASGLATAPAQASLVTNGSFESPAIAAATFLNVVGGAEPVGFGWTVTVNNVDIFANGVLSTTGLVYEGTQALDLVGFGSSGGIRQSFATTAGATYRLRFAYGNNPISTAGASAAVQVADGTTALLSDSVSHTTSTASDLDWDLYEGLFVGTGGTVTLSFTNLTGGSNGGVFLDAVTVDEVVVTPALALPATPALVGLGLWAAAAVRRRPAR